MRQRCRISYVTRVPSWYWLTVGQRLLPLMQIRVEGQCFIYFLLFFFISVSSLSFILLFLPCPSPSSPLLSLFSFSLGGDTKWPTMIDVSLNLPENTKIGWWTRKVDWLLTLVLPNPDKPCLCKQCRSRSIGFWRSQLILTCTVAIKYVNLYQQPWSSNLIGWN